MNTSKVKARLQDIKAGVTLFISHPVYGIEKVVVTSKPKMIRYEDGIELGPFFDCLMKGKYGRYETQRSTHDAGITADYNGRRTFFKLKHAQQWQDHQLRNESFLVSHANHEAFCEAMDHHYD